MHTGKQAITILDDEVRDREGRSCHRRVTGHRLSVTLTVTLTGTGEHEGWSGHKGLVKHWAKC